MASFAPSRLCALLVFSFGAAAPAQTGFTLDHTKREEVRTFFRTVYAASEDVPMGWTGNIKKGVAGSNSAAFVDATELRVNFFRAMAGVSSDVNFSDTFSSKAQQAALMMSANRSLNHQPPKKWRFYTAAGAEAAANSNLALGNVGPDAITGFIEDFGKPNDNAGHRRWVLYPQTKSMGTGDVPKVGSFPAANALWIQDENFGGPRPATREEFVAWPPPGFVPHPLVFPRWSFSYADADFSQASVALTRGGSAVPVKIDSRNAAGFGENTLVWVIDNLNPNRPHVAEAPAADTTISVSVTNVLIGGVPRDFAYDVTVFDVASRGLDTVTQTISGPVDVALNVPVNFSFNGVPGATGYETRISALNDFTAVEGAEAGTTNVTVNGGGAKHFVSKTVHASGNASFHLANPGFKSQSLILNSSIVVRDTSVLQFQSRLRGATPAQTAHVQVSTDDGATWVDVDTQHGTGATGEKSFHGRSVPLTTFAGLPLKVRFLYTAAIGRAVFTQSSDQFGWFIDDIAVTNAGEIASSTSVALPAGATVLPFQGTSAGLYALQVRPQFYGRFFTEYSRAAFVSVPAASPLRTALSVADFDIQDGATADSATVRAMEQLVEASVSIAAEDVSSARVVTVPSASSTVVSGIRGGMADSGTSGLHVTPLVSTGTATSISPTTETLFGNIAATGQIVAWQFEYTTGASSPNFTEMQPFDGASGVEWVVNGLEPDKIYQFRLIGIGPDGSRFVGVEQNFLTTPADGF